MTNETNSTRESWPSGLLDRVKAAERRIRDNHAPRRIPADPTDVDLVLAEVRMYLEGTAPPFWLAVIDAHPSEPSESIAMRPFDLNAKRHSENDVQRLISGIEESAKQFGLVMQADARGSLHLAAKEVCTPDEPQAEILGKAVALIDEAKARGVVLSIEQTPLLPLAMGHYESVARVWQAHEAREVVLTHGDTQ